MRSWCHGDRPEPVVTARPERDGIFAEHSHLLADETLAEQAKANTEEQFAMGSFRDAFMDVVVDAQDAQNNIADQMLKDPRIFGAVEGMLAKMLYQQFLQGRSP
jgi:hypothetical protein